MGSALAERLPGFALLELDRVRVVGRDAPETVFALLGDESMAGSEHFAEIRARHDAMLAAFRAQDWQGAKRALASLASHAPAFGLSPLYALYAERVAALVLDPPRGDWDGVFAAKEK